MTYDAEDEIFKVTLDGKLMQTTDDLFAEMVKKLKFPDYFGNNWNAMLDCLRDFAWIKQDKIEITIINKEYILNPDYKDEKDFFFKIIEASKENWIEDKSKQVDYLIL